MSGSRTMERFILANGIDINLGPSRQGVLIQVPVLELE